MSIEHFTMFAFGFLSAWICCQIQAEALRRIIRRKPRNDRSGPQFNEGRTIRGNGNGGPTTPKPQFPPGRVLGPDGETIGYRSIPSGRDTVSPPRNP